MKELSNNHVNRSYGLTPTQCSLLCKLLPVVLTDGLLHCSRLHFIRKYLFHDSSYTSSQPNLSLTRKPLHFLFTILLPLTPGCLSPSVVNCLLMQVSLQLESRYSLGWDKISLRAFLHSGFLLNEWMKSLIAPITVNPKLSCHYQSKGPPGLGMELSGSAPSSILGAMRKWEWDFSTLAKTNLLKHIPFSILRSLILINIVLFLCF